VVSIGLTLFAGELVRRKRRRETKRPRLRLPKLG